MNPGRQMMSVRSVIKRFHRPQPYRGALIHRESREFESLVHVFLWTGVVLCVSLVCQQTYHFFEESRQAPQSNQQQKSQQTLITSIAPMPPADVLPVVQDRQAGLVQSLFRFKPAETKALPSVNRQPEIAASTKVTQQANPRVWQLEVTRLHETNIAQQLANAKYQLQSGYFDLARQSFEQILQQDPHHVVALVGMLVVIDQQGDLTQREDYLRRIRQEIPDYVPDDDPLLLQVAD
ncbi:lipopolysaccharide assembly protein LapB [Methylophilus sp. TWE2]|uniref:tetratricopeptide repeat protein n=1 Tax=Methylophilus sp. TWE2 TaxID=1662285 RepID=UPI00069EFD68|nr:tetratricopeptide repeat protein [Methylophilus sp. TWE2]